MELNNDLDWWRPRLAAWQRLREGADVDDAARRGAGEAYGALLSLALYSPYAHSALPRAVKNRFGDERWERAVGRKIEGDRESSRELKSFLDTMASHAQEGTLQSPLALATTTFNNLANDILKSKVDRLRVAPDEDGVEAWENHDTGDMGPLGPDVVPEALPAAVADTFEYVLRFLPVYEVLVEKVDGRPYTEVASALNRDVELGPGRWKWQREPGPTKDQWARAWQAAYHDREDHIDYLGDGEVPASSESHRAAYDQHVSRFRRLWSAATAQGAVVVDEKPGHSLADGPRVPVQWDPPTHPTLQGRSR